MAIDVRPATVFEDVCTVVGPKRPDANVCSCLTARQVWSWARSSPYADLRGGRR